MGAELLGYELSEKQFERISRMMYGVCGVNLQQGKEGLVKSRLAKRLRALGLEDFDSYASFVESDTSGTELVAMIDLLTTNKTSFFRESQHFDFLRRTIVPRLLANGGKMRFWSAGCSSGEEPYTMALVLAGEVPNISRYDVRILATDISVRILEKAKAAVYPQETLADVPQDMVRRCFDQVSMDQPRSYRVKPELRSLVHFARLNLMNRWPMSGPFDAIFCRNVMIYFDKPTQQELVRRFYDLLAPGGYLFVGHSESLTATPHLFRYVQPAAYVK